MLPHFHIFGIHVPSFSLMLFLGVVAFFGILIISHRSLCKADRITFNRFLFVTCLSVIALALFAFLFNSLFHSIASKRLVFGGITWLGGVIGAIPVFLILSHFMIPKKRGYEMELFSSLMPGIALAHAFGRVGCFLGGCCYGRVSDSPLSVVYPAGSLAARQYPSPDGKGSLPVLPTPIFEAAFELLLFALFILLPKRAKKYSLSLYSICYGSFRFAAEFARGDMRGSVGGFISPSQLLSVLLIIFGVLLLLEQKGIIFKGFHSKRMALQATSDAMPITHLYENSDALLLRELHSLLEEGVITEQEYEEKKKEILDRM